jgi:hypothetical protein
VEELAMAEQSLSPRSTGTILDAPHEGGLERCARDGATVADDLAGMTLVDEDEPLSPAIDWGKMLLTATERAELDASSAKSGAQSTEDDLRASLTLSGECLTRGHQACRDFASGRDPSEVGEEILHELVAGELSIALALQDIEAAMAALVAKAVTDPKLSLAVARSFAEAVALSGAIRRRMEGSLGAAASLRAQRMLLAAQTGRFHD